MTRKEHVETRVQVAMAVFGLTHTRQTKVGNDFVRGVSGGERKRVRSVVFPKPNIVHLLNLEPVSPRCFCHMLE